MIKCPLSPFRSLCNIPSMETFFYFHRVLTTWIINESNEPYLTKKGRSPDCTYKELLGRLATWSEGKKKKSPYHSNVISQVFELELKKARSSGLGRPSTKNNCDWQRNFSRSKWLGPRTLKKFGQIVISYRTRSIGDWLIDWLMMKDGGPSHNTVTIIHRWSHMLLVGVVVCSLEWNDPATMHPLSGLRPTGTGECQDPLHLTKGETTEGYSCLFYVSFF